MELVQMESNRVRDYRDDRLELDFQSRSVYLDGAPVRLTPLEFDTATGATRPGTRARSYRAIR